MTRIRSAALGLALAIAFPAAMLAQAPDKSAGAKPPTAKQAPKPKKESAAALKQEARITEAEASATALAAVRGGKIHEKELEREDGKLIYSFDIKVAGKSGTEEVHIDALTGTLIASKHETPADEAKEKAADKKAAPRKPAAAPPVKKP